jgi:hypothetical protein
MPTLMQSQPSIQDDERQSLEHTHNKQAFSCIFCDTSAAHLGNTSYHLKGCSWLKRAVHLYRRKVASCVIATCMEFGVGCSTVDALGARVGPYAAQVKGCLSRVGHLTTSYTM